MTRHTASVLCALLGASVTFGGCSGSSSDGPVQPGGGGAAKLAFTVQPSASVTAGAAITPAVQVAVEDASGNTVTNAANSITLAIGTNPANGSISGTTTVAAVNGVATFSTLGMDKTATGYTLIASAPGLTGATSSAFTVVAGAPAKLTFAVQPSDAVVSAAIAPAVKVAVQDAHGNAVTTATNSIMLAVGTNPTNGTLAGAAAVAAVAGVATFSNVSVSAVGTGYTLIASAAGLTGATSGAFNIAAGPAAKLAFIVQPANAVSGAAITPAVQVAVQDALGNTATTAATSITLAIGTNPAAGTLSGTTTVVAVHGVATFPALSINNPGTGYTLKASAPSLTLAVSSGFSVTSAAVPITDKLRLSAGYSATCGVTTGGAAYCWGRNELGQLGNGSHTSGLAPVAVSGGLSFASVSVGAGPPSHTCAVTVSGAAYCWGADSLGELGNGSTTDSPTPVAVSGGHAFATVSAGQGFTCGLTTGGAAYCWGRNELGQLGNGSTTNSSTPIAVAGGLSFATVSAGALHACGVTTTGAAYCWGDNHSGALGGGSTAYASLTPVSVRGGLTFVTVTANAFYACGVTTSGAAYCWGEGSSYQLGNGSNVSADAPVAVTGGLVFTTVSAGITTACGVTTSGAAYCWGNNNYGELGNGSAASFSPTPVAVSGGLTFAAVTAAGYFQTCGLTTGGTAYCWGHAVRSTGNSDSSTPLAVPGGLTF